MNTTASRQTPPMVLICSAGKSSDRLVSRWNQSGQKLSAVVIAIPKPERHLSSEMTKLKHSGTPVIDVRHPVDCSKIETALSSVQTELLVCYGFMRLIPNSLLRMFTHGGVNFHPTLLPAYRGPHPTQCLVSDGTYSRWGGLTLHKLTECYDKGDILAQAKFLPQDYRSVSAYRGVLVSTMIAMVKEVVPFYCSGLLVTKQQVHDTSAWARYHPRCTVITQDWTADEVAAACAFLRQRERIFVHLPGGMPISITGFRKHLKCVDGTPNTLNPITLDFNCADARVSVYRNTRLGRFAHRITIKIQRLRDHDITRPLEFETRSSSKYTNFKDDKFLSFK